MLLHGLTMCGCADQMADRTITCARWLFARGKRNDAKETWISLRRWRTPGYLAISGLKICPFATWSGLYKQIAGMVAEAGSIVSRHCGVAEKLKKIKARSCADVSAGLNIF